LCHLPALQAEAAPHANDARAVVEHEWLHAWVERRFDALLIDLVLDDGVVAVVGLCTHGNEPLRLLDARNTIQPLKRLLPVLFAAPRDEPHWPRPVVDHPQHALIHAVVYH